MTLSYDSISGQLIWRLRIDSGNWYLDLKYSGSITRKVHLTLGKKFSGRINIYITFTL